MAEIGSILRETRMRARIDISEVEAHTKIRAKYLRAIENEDWDLLPGPVFVTSFLKTYGDYLGVDSRPLVDEFKRRYESPTDHDVRPIASRTRERERAARRHGGPRVPPAAAIVVVLLVVVGVLYLIGHGNNNKMPGTPAGSGTGQHHHHRHRGQGAGGGRTTTTKTHTTTTPVVPKVATLSLAQVTAPVWVCVENASGKRLINGVTYSPGDTIPTVKSAELLVNLGNNNVAVKINGKPYTPATTAAIGLRITPTHVSPLTPAPTCG
jgi:hypothetical protein